MEKHTNMRIGLGSVVKANAGELENITRKEKIRRMRKEVVVFFHIVVGNKNLLIKFKYG